MAENDLVRNYSMYYSEFVNAHSFSHLYCVEYFDFSDLEIY